MAERFARALSRCVHIFEGIESSQQCKVTPSGVILLSDTDSPTLENTIEDCTDWMFNRTRGSAVRHGADTLETLGRLVLVDFMVFLTSKWIKGLRQSKEDIEKRSTSIQGDGLPTVRDFVLPTASLAEKADLLLESLNLPSSTHFIRDTSNPLDPVAEDLAVQSTHMKQSAIQLQALNATRLDDQLKRSNIQESNAVKRLTILASIFLPLSLTAGLLSMQNRLKDIHLVLWDFIAISIDLGFIALSFFWITKSSRLPFLVTSFKRICTVPYGWAVNEQGKISRRQVWDIVWWTLSFPVLAIIAVALNFGMFGNVQVAWKILGYGIAAGGGLLIVAGALYAGFSFLWAYFDAHDDSGYG